MTDWPRVTVITPSFNQAAFLEATLQSVLGQEYPNLEYFVHDGGSTDGSVEILRRYEARLSGWISERDAGQADAINHGFARATGEILCWLNSDDLHTPGTLRRVAEHFRDRLATAAILTGACRYFVDGSAREWIRPASQPDSARLRRCDYLVQPCTFWTAAAWRKTGPLDASMHFTFDWDWFIRADEAGCEFAITDQLLAAYRIHAQHKTGTGGDKRRDEILALLRRHADGRTAEIFEWVRSQPAQWKRMSRWRQLHRWGMPLALATLACPALWRRPRGFPLQIVGEMVDSL